MKKISKLFDVAESEGLRYYGDGGTIHSTGHVDVETHNGKVVAVWFRCSLVPFVEHYTDDQRAKEMQDAYQDNKIAELDGLVFKK